MSVPKAAVLINGELSHSLSCYDRGLNFGDGVFETMAVIQGQILYWDAHMQRLLESCMHLGIASPDPDQVKSECQSVLTNECRQVIKIIITRGVGGRGYAYEKDQLNTRIIFRKPWPNYGLELLESGVRVGFSSIDIHTHPHLAGIKHLNALEQVLATADCQAQGFDECIRGNAQKELIEGCKSNLFIVKDDQLYTPCLANYGIAGIMRQQVMVKAIEIGLTVKEVPMDKEDVMQADELFLTNSLIGIWPIVSLNEQPFSKGKWSRRLIELLGIPAYYL